MPSHQGLVMIMNEDYCKSCLLFDRDCVCRMVVCCDRMFFRLIQLIVDALLNCSRETLDLIMSRLLSSQTASILLSAAATADDDDDD